MRYQVIPRTLIFIFQEDRVLLLKGASDKKNFPDAYNGLGGHVERGETILESARRELSEESGLSVPDLHLCGILQVDGDESTGVQVCIFKGFLDGDPESIIESEEGSLFWIPVEKINEINMVPDVPLYFNRINTWQPGDPLFFASSGIEPGGKIFVHIDGELKSG